MIGSRGVRFDHSEPVGRWVQLLAPGTVPGTVKTPMQTDKFPNHMMTYTHETSGIIIWYNDIHNYNIVRSCIIVANVWRNFALHGQKWSNGCYDVKLTWANRASRSRPNYQQFKNHSSLVCHVWNYSDNFMTVVITKWYRPYNMGWRCPFLLLVSKKVVVNLSIVIRTGDGVLQKLVALVHRAGGRRQFETRLMAVQAGKKSSMI